MSRSEERSCPEVELRLRCVEYALSHTVAAAVRIFHRSAATIYKQHGVRGLTPRSRRPKRARKHRWSAEAELEVLRLRHLHRSAGKIKLRELLLAEGIDPSESTIGRILTPVKTRNLRIEPITGVTCPRAKSQRPYTTRVRKTSGSLPNLVR